MLLFKAIFSNSKVSHFTLLILLFWLSRIKFAAGHACCGGKSTFHQPRWYELEPQWFGCEIKARDWRGVVRDKTKGTVYTHKDNKHVCFLNTLHRDWLPSQRCPNRLASSAVMALEGERPMKKGFLFNRTTGYRA